MGPVFLKDLRHQFLIESAELSPALLCDQLKLCMACATLTLSAGNKELNLVTWHQFQGMLGLLNLYLDKELNLSWRKLSVVVSKTQETWEQSCTMNSQVDSAVLADQGASAPSP